MQSDSQTSADQSASSQTVGYVAPTISDLGSFAELTQGNMAGGMTESGSSGMSMN